MNNFCINTQVIRNILPIISLEISKNVEWQSTALKCFAILEGLTIGSAIYFSAISLSTGIIIGGLVFLVVKIGLIHLGGAVVEEESKVIVYKKAFHGPFKKLPDDLFARIILLVGQNFWNNLLINSCFVSKMKSFIQSYEKKFIKSKIKLPFTPHELTDLHEAKALNRFGQPKNRWDTEGIELWYKADERVIQLNIQAAKSGSHEREEALNWLKSYSESSLSLKSVDGYLKEFKLDLMVNFALGDIYSISDSTLSSMYYKKGWESLISEKLPYIDVITLYYGKDLGEKRADEVSSHFNSLLDANIEAYKKCNPLETGSPDENQQSTYFSRFFYSILKAKELPPYYQEKRQEMILLYISKLSFDGLSQHYPIIVCRINTVLKNCPLPTDLSDLIEIQVSVTRQFHSRSGVFYIELMGDYIEGSMQYSELLRYFHVQDKPSRQGCEYLWSLAITKENFSAFRDILSK